MFAAARYKKIFHFCRLIYTSCLHYKVQYSGRNLYKCYSFCIQFFMPLKSVQNIEFCISTFLIRNHYGVFVDFDPFSVLVYSTCVYSTCTVLVYTVLVKYLVTVLVHSTWLQYLVTVLVYTVLV